MSKSATQRNTAALPQSDRELLYELQFWGTASISGLAKKRGLRESTLQSKISRWEKDGAIGQRVFINTFQIGASEIEVFFSPSKEVKGAQEHLTKAVLKSSGVRWFYRTAGKHEFIVGLEATSLNQLTKHLEDLDSKARGIFASRDMALSLGYWWFGRKYLAPEGTKHTYCLAQLPTTKTVEIDTIDHRILREIGQHGAQSTRTVAHSLNIPQSTIGYRLGALEKKGVIIGFPYLVSAFWLGMHIYRLQITFTTFSHEIHKELLRWCQQHPAVVSMMRLLGPWDYTLRCEFYSAEEVVELTDTLHEKFGSALKDCSIVSIVKELSFSYYPLEVLGE